MDGPQVWWWQFVYIIGLVLVAALLVVGIASNAH